MLRRLAALAVCFQIITTSFTQKSEIEVQTVHISQFKGNDTSKCGSIARPCKTIAMGLSQARRGALVYVDGTGSETSPYNCISPARNFPGIFSNKSIKLFGVQTMVDVKCQEGYHVHFVSSISETNTTVYISNFKFISTSIKAVDINLHVDRCIFSDGSQAVNLSQLTNKPSVLSFTDSLCVNTSSCITVLATRGISIEVTNSNIMKSWLKSDELGSAIHVAPTYDYEVTIACSITIQNVTFKDNILGDRGLLYINLTSSFSSLKLEDVLFTENLAHRPQMEKYISLITLPNAGSFDVSVHNTRFVRNLQGLFLFFNAENTQGSSTIDITHSQFENNSAAVMTIGKQKSQSLVKLSVQNTTFIGNIRRCITVVAKFAEVIISNSIFKKNTHVGCGGVLSINASVRNIVSIDRCEFESNSAYNGAGGLVSMHGNSVRIAMVNTVMSKTTSTYSGGILDIGATTCLAEANVIKSAILRLANLTIQSTSSGLLGGIVALNADTAVVELHDSFINDTKANGPGGVIYSIKSEISLEVINTTIFNSVTTELGGVIYVQKVNSLIFDNVTIDTALSKEFCGAICVGGKENAILSINNLVMRKCHFETISASCGGAISLTQFSLAKIQIMNSLFESNIAGSGGCICLLRDGKDVDFVLRNVTFRNCQSLSDVGGALYWYQWNGTLEIESSTFVDNKATSGGAIYFLHGGGRIIIKSSKFIGNSATSQHGGAMALVYSQDKNDAIVSQGCTGSPQNYRLWSYGVIQSITDSKFVNNTAALGGGALHFSQGNHSLLECTFVNNIAELQGGHIMLESDSTSLKIYNSNFSQDQQKRKKEGKLIDGMFIYSKSEARLDMHYSRMESQIPQGGESNTLLHISNGNSIDFGINHIASMFICPTGTRINILNFRTLINTYYVEKGHTKKCKIGITLLQFYCKACSGDTYSLQHGQSRGLTEVSGFQCLPCPFGAECVNKISAKPNYWGYKVKESPPALKFTLCPLGYCNKTKTNDFVNYNHCLGNRNGTLCGECKKNYTETLLSPCCRHVDHCQDTWLWGVAVVMVTLAALFLVHKPQLFRMLKTQTLWFKNIANKDEESEAEDDDAGGGYLKIVFYFYQVVNILLVSMSYDKTIVSHFLQPIIGLFNFQLRFSTNGFLCPIRGLNVVTKQLLFASGVFAIMSMILICYCCHRLLRRCRSKSAPNTGSYISAVLETLLLGYAVFANTSLKLLRCTPLVEETSVLFIDGNVV